MINLKSLLPSAGFPSPAAQSPGNGNTSPSGPVNLFAALIQKLLGNLGGKTDGAGVPAGPLSRAGLTDTHASPLSGFGLSDPPVSGPVAPGKNGPVSRQSKGSPGGRGKGSLSVQQAPQAVVLQITPLVTVPAAGTGGPVPGVLTAGSSVDADLMPADAQGVEDAGSGVAGMPGPFATPAVGTGPGGTDANPAAANALTAQSANPVKPAGPSLIPLTPGSGGNTLASIFKNIVLSGNAAMSMPPRSGGVVDSAAVNADSSDLPLPGLHASTGVVTPDLKGDPVSDSPFILPDLRASIDEVVPVPVEDPAPESVATPPAGGPVNVRTQATQTSSAAPSLAAMPAVETPPPGEIDPSILPRTTGGQFSRESGILRRMSDDSQDTEKSTAADETSAAAPSPGFFADVVRNVMGVLSGNGANTADPNADAQDGPSPSVVSTGDGERGATAAVTDTDALQAKKPANDRQPDPPVAPATDSAVREQVDPVAIRSGQGSLGPPVIAEKAAPNSPAAPVRELPAPYAPLPGEVSARIAEQVVRNLKLQVDGTTSEIRMTLKPPSLGDVQLSVRVEDSRMQAQIDVSQQVVKSALEAHMPQLRAALQEHGIEVQRIDVMLPGQSLQGDGAGSGDGRTDRKNGRRFVSDDDAETYQGAKDMGYNTIELIM